MKAFLLAGGLGERLRPFTLTLPKCLVPINGVPLLEIWLDLSLSQGVTEVLLNVSQHPQQVAHYLERRSRGPRVTLVVEDHPVGTAGTVRDNRHFIDGEESFWVFYSDNLTNLSLDAMRATHERHDGALTMGLFHAPVPTAAGIVQMDPKGRIVGFTEKPEHPVGDLANAGIYLARPSLLREIPATGTLVDFGHDVLPRLEGQMHGHVIEGFLMDIGTPHALATASAAWARLGPRR